MDIPEDVLDSSNLPRGVSFLPDSQSFVFGVEGNSTSIENPLLTKAEIKYKDGMNVLIAQRYVSIAHEFPSVYSNGSGRA